MHEDTSVFRASPPPFCLSNSAETLPKGATEFCKIFSTIEIQMIFLPRSPKGATEFCGALQKGFSRIRKAKWRRGSTKNARIFVYTPLSGLIYNCAALTSQALSSDTKFSPSQSRETLPLKAAV